MNVIDFLQTITVSGAAVTVFVQFLKSNFVPATVFNKYPRLTTLASSIAVTAFVAWQKCQTIVAGCASLFREPIDYIAAVIGVFFIAVVLYNNVLRDTKQA